MNVYYVSNKRWQLLSNRYLKMNKKLETGLIL